MAGSMVLGKKAATQGTPGSPPPKLLSVQATADRLDVSTQTVRRLIKAGSLPACRIGRQIRTSESDLAYYISQRQLK